MLQFEIRGLDALMRDFDKLEREIRRAQDAATRQVAREIIVPAVKNALSFTGEKAPIGQLGTRTGRTRRQVKAKFFRGKDGLLNGAVKVRGDRAHIARFNEDGTLSHGRYGGGRKLGQGFSRAELRYRAVRHGGGPLPARKMFETVGRAIRSLAEARLASAFESNLRTNLVGF